MSGVTVRYTGEQPPVGLFAYLKEKGLLFFVKEYGKDGDNPHFHGVLSGNYNTIKAHFKRNVGGGQKVYAVGLTDNIQKSVQYCCKDLNRDDYPSQVIYNDGFDIVALAAASAKVQLDIKVAKKRKRIDNPLDECWDDIQKEIGESTNGKTIAAAVLKWYIEHGRRAPSGYVMQTAVITYLCRNNNKDQSSDKLSYEDIVSRVYPNITF